MSDNKYLEDEADNYIENNLNWVHQLDSEHAMKEGFIAGAKFIIEQNQKESKAEKKPKKKTKTKKKSKK